MIFAFDLETENFKVQGQGLQQIVYIKIYIHVIFEIASINRYPRMEINATI